MRRRRRARAARHGLRIAAVLAGVLLAGCDMCDIGDLRCSGSVVEECNDMRNWEDLHDCGTDQCGVGREVCDPWIDPGFGEVWCCFEAP